jgi:hypothetical protein
VLRRISNSLLSLLMMATLFWGGCVACPQFFMFSQAAKKDCCKAGRCEKSQSGKTTKANDCRRLPLEPHGFVQALAEPPTVAIASVELVLPAVAPSPATLELAPVEYSPPELHVLNSTFLI